MKAKIPLKALTEIIEIASIHNEEKSLDSEFIFSYAVSTDVPNR